MRVVGEGPAYSEYPEIFTRYKIEKNLFNGRVHYMSQDGKLDLAFNAAKMQWFIQDTEMR